MPNGIKRINGNTICNGVMAAVAHGCLPTFLLRNCVSHAIRLAINFKKAPLPIICAGIAAASQYLATTFRSGAPKALIVPRLPKSLDATHHALLTRGALNAQKLGNVLGAIRLLTVPIIASLFTFSELFTTTRMRADKALGMVNVIHGPHQLLLDHHLTVKAHNAGGSQKVGATQNNPIVLPEAVHVLHEATLFTSQTLRVQKSVHAVLSETQGMLIGAKSFATDAAFAFFS